jgi:branched-chain amino acid transport system ATP-binding protein
VSALLEVDGLSVRYGGVIAVNGVSLAVEQGSVTGLIGPNGAGKTTFVDALTGFTPCTGEIRFKGRSVAGLSPHRLAGLGIVRTFQSIELFDDLSVEENVRITVDSSGGRDPWRPFGGGGRSAADRVAAALASVGLDDVATAMPTDLSHGQQKLVALARATAAEPELLLLDEPAAGFSVAETEDLGRRLRELAKSGMTVLLIDHDMSLVLGFTDYVYVLEFGHLIAHGSPEQVRTDEHVIAAYLGEPIETESQEEPAR